MSEKHTPGPWEWDSTVWSYDPQQDAPWLVSSEDSAFPDTPVLKGEITCRSEADALLIAAAPELLNALQWLVDILPDPELDNDELQRVWTRKARAVIEKATGVKP